MALKGDQHKIDVNNDGTINAKDFRIIRKMKRKSKKGKKLPKRMEEIRNRFNAGKGQRAQINNKDIIT